MRSVLVRPVEDDDGTVGGVRQYIKHVASEVSKFSKDVFSQLSWLITQGGIGEVLNPQTEAETTAGVTIVDYSYPPLNVMRYGADPTGVASSTTAFLAAISAAQAQTNGGHVYIPDGTYLITSTLTVSGNRIHVYGEGPDATRIVFTPTATDVLFEFNNSSNLVQCSLKHLAIYSSDSTYTKTAIDLYDVSEFDLEDVTVLGGVVVSSTNYWSGNSATSIGVRIRGRQTISLRNVHIQADRPILISANPNNDIDHDHCNYHNLYVVANANPCIEAENGVSLGNVSFTGYQAWVRGTAGFRYVSTSAFAFNPYMFFFENVRTEQGEDDTAYSFDITCTSGLIGEVTLKNCYLDQNRNGIRTSRVLRHIFDNVTYASSSLEALDITGVDSGAQFTQVSIRKCYWQTTSTATLSSLRLVWSLPKGGSTQPLPPDAEYAYDSSTVGKNFTIDYALGGSTISLTNGSTAVIGPTGVVGMLSVSGGDGGNALFSINGTANSVNEVSDPLGIFSATAGTGSSTNVYWDAGQSQYEIENNRGSTLTYKLTLIGSYIDF